MIDVIGVSTKGGITQSLVYAYMSHATPLEIVGAVILVALIAKGLRGKFVAK